MPAVSLGYCVRLPLKLGRKSHKSLVHVRQIITTDQAPAPVGPYNQAVVASGSMVFVAGHRAY